MGINSVVGSTALRTAKEPGGPGGGGAAGGIQVVGGEDGGRRGARIPDPRRCCRLYFSITGWHWSSQLGNFPSWLNPSQPNPARRSQARPPPFPAAIPCRQAKPSHAKPRHATPSHASVSPTSTAQWGSPSFNAGPTGPADPTHRFHPPAMLGARSSWVGLTPLSITHTLTCTGKGGAWALLYVHVGGVGRAANAAVKAAARLQCPRSRAAHRL